MNATASRSPENATASRSPENSLREFSSSVEAAASRSPENSLARILQFHGGGCFAVARKFAGMDATVL